MRISQKKKLKRMKSKNIIFTGRVMYNIKAKPENEETLSSGKFIAIINDVKITGNNMLVTVVPNEKLCLNCNRNKSIHDERDGMCYFGMSMFANFRGMKYTWRPDLYCSNCLEKTVAGRTNCSHCGRDY